MLLACGTATAMGKYCGHEPAETFLSVLRMNCLFLVLTKLTELKYRKEDLNSDN